MAFNGGKSQVQSQFLLQGGDYPFINFIKTMQSWTYNNATVVNPAELDGNGYLTTGVTNGVNNIMFIPPSKTGAGTTWCLDWDGRGNVNIAPSVGGAINITNGAILNNIGGSASNYVEFTFPSLVGGDGAINLYINGIGTNGSDYPHNMRLYLLSEKTRPDSQQRNLRH